MARKRDGEERFDCELYATLFVWEERGVSRRNKKAGGHRAAGAGILCLAAGERGENQFWAGETAERERDRSLTQSHLADCVQSTPPVIALLQGRQEKSKFPCLCWEEGESFQTTESWGWLLGPVSCPDDRLLKWYQWSRPIILMNYRYRVVLLTNYRVISLPACPPSGLSHL